MKVKGWKLTGEIKGTENTYTTVRINYYPKLVIHKDESKSQIFSYTN